MKRVLAAVLCAVLVLSCFASCAGQQTEDVPLVPVVQTLGHPVLDYYGEEETEACNIWELSVFDGRLYLGCGDYDKNTGPTPVYSYELESPLPADDARRFAEEGFLDTESATRFHTLSFGFAASSTDPCGGDWTRGSFNVRRQDGTWEVRTIPYAVHNFDLIEFDGALFCAVGVKEDTPATPVMKSTDGGETWEELSFYKDGAEFVPASVGTEFCRGYDFFVLRDTLYVNLLLSGSGKWEYAVYRLEAGAFVYHSTLKSCVGLENALPSQRPFLSSVTFEDTLYLTAGKLYTTENLQTFAHVPFGDFSAVWDLWTQGEELFVLTSVPNEDGTYKMTVYRAESCAPQEYSAHFSFDYPLCCRSMAYADGVFYFGTDASFSTLTEDNRAALGTLLSVTLTPGGVL